MPDAETQTDDTMMEQFLSTMHFNPYTLSLLNCVAHDDDGLWEYIERDHSTRVPHEPPKRNPLCNEFKPEASARKRVLQNTNAQRELAMELTRGDAADGGCWARIWPDEALLNARDDYGDAIKSIISEQGILVRLVKLMYIDGGHGDGTSESIYVFSNLISGDDEVHEAYDIPSGATVRVPSMTFGLNWKAFAVEWSGAGHWRKYGRVINGSDHEAAVAPGLLDALLARLDNASATYVNRGGRLWCSWPPAATATDEATDGYNRTFDPDDDDEDPYPFHEERRRMYPDYETAELNGIFDSDESDFDEDEDEEEEEGGDRNRQEQRCGRRRPRRRN